MRPRKRDPAFLRMAAVAATGGILAIVCAIGFPIMAVRYGRPYTPAFSLFAGWGIAALAGAYACLRTYFLTDPAPERPPPGGVKLTVLHGADARAAQAESPEPDRRAA